MEFPFLNWDFIHGKVPNPCGIFPSHPQLCEGQRGLGFWDFGDFWEGVPGVIPNPFLWDFPVWAWNSDPGVWDKSGSRPVGAHPKFLAVFSHHPKFGELPSVPPFPIPAQAPKFSLIFP